MVLAFHSNDPGWSVRRSTLAFGAHGNEGTDNNVSRSSGSNCLGDADHRGFTAGVFIKEETTGEARGK